MAVTKYTDNNGNVYNAISPTAWSGSEGSTLRSQGWTYCGFGTGGVYIAPPGAPCFTKSAVPSIGPTVPTDTPGSAPTSAVPDSACGSCKKSATNVPTNPITGAPVTTFPTQPAARSTFPWWVWVLLALTLAEIVNRGRNNA